MTDQTDKLLKLNGELCAEINAKDRRIRELESLVRDMYVELDSMRDDVFLIDYIDKRIATFGIEVDG